MTPFSLSESFSDQGSVAAGQIISSLTIRAGERVDGVSLEVKAPTAATFSHGGTGGTPNTLTLAADDYITPMEEHWGEKRGRTRMSFGTNAGKTVSGGSQTDSKSTVTAPEGFQLGGFFGQDGDEIDKLGAIWSRISAEAPTPAPAPAPVALAISTADSASAVSDKSLAADSSVGSADSSAPASAESSTDASGSATEVTKPTKPGKPSTSSTESSVDGSDALTDVSIGDSGSGSAGEVAQEAGKQPAASTGTSVESGAGPETASTDATAASGSTEPLSTKVSTASSADGSAPGPGAQAPAPAPAETEAPAVPTMSGKDSVQLSESFG